MKQIFVAITSEEYRELVAEVADDFDATDPEAVEALYAEEGDQWVEQSREVGDEYITSVDVKVGDAWELAFSR